MRPDLIIPGDLGRQSNSRVQRSADKVGSRAEGPVGVPNEVEAADAVAASEREEGIGPKDCTKTCSPREEGLCLCFKMDRYC